MSELLPEVVLRTLADDMTCDVADLLADANRVTLQSHRPLRRHFPVKTPGLEMVTLGCGTVITTDASLRDWAERELRPMSSGELFGASGLRVISAKLSELGLSAFGPSPVYVCNRARSWPAPQGMRIDRLEGEQIAKLYQHEGLRMALSYYTAGERPDVLAVAAYDGGTLAGVAACSADSDAMWQVGIDVVGEFRGRGLAKALVGDVTHRILELGKIPYYSTGMANVASQRIAIATGYYPAWTALMSR